MKKLISFPLAFALVLFLSVFAEASKQHKPRSIRTIATHSEKVSDVPAIMPLSEVKIGMIGYGLTVFHGTKPERFGFKVAGFEKTIKGFETIFVDAYDLRGNVIKNANIIAGMSGSPMFIDNKIIGALAYTGEFTKTPWALVTPIEHMMGFWPKNLDEPNKYLLPEDRQGMADKDKPLKRGLGDAYCYFLSWGDFNIVFV